MKPRSKSPWIAPAAWGALVPFRICAQRVHHKKKNDPSQKEEHLGRLGAFPDLCTERARHGTNDNGAHVGAAPGMHAAAPEPHQQSSCTKSGSLGAHCKRMEQRRGGQWACTCALLRGRKASSLDSRHAPLDGSVAFCDNCNKASPQESKHAPLDDDCLLRQFQQGQPK